MSNDLELFHFGVKGMKWGVRRKVDSDGLAIGKPPGKSGDSAGSSGGSDRAAARQEKKANRARLKELDKASKERDKASKARDEEERVKSIDAARERMKSGEAAKEWKDAKAQYNRDKKVIGKREAGKILDKALDKYNKEFETSMQVRDGKEALRNALIGGAAQIALNSVIK